jgi:hypothetical protein
MRGSDYLSLTGALAFTWANHLRAELVRRGGGNLEHVDRKCKWPIHSSTDRHTVARAAANATH